MTTTAALTSYLVKRCVFGVWRLLGRVLPSARLLVEALPRFRSDAFLYLTLARIDSIALSFDTLYDLGFRLDTWSYLELLSRCRPTAREGARRIGMTDSDVTISFDYYAPTGPGTMHSPYFLHPSFYADGSFRYLNTTPCATRSIRLVFAGTCDKEAYSSDFPFPILDRSKVIEYIIDTFRDDCFIASSRAEAVRVRKIDRPIVFVLTRKTEDTLEKHLLTPQEYLGLLKDSDFALCPPGCRMPHSHNIIEAMVHGTIPVTNYATDLHPPLTPGHNCVNFSTLQELDLAIRDVLSVPSNHTRQMRIHVTAYAEQWLTYTNFANSIRSIKWPLVIRVNDECESIRLFHNRLQKERFEIDTVILHEQKDNTHLITNK